MSSPTLSRALPGPPGVRTAAVVALLAAGWLWVCFQLPAPLGPAVVVLPFVLAWLVHRETHPALLVLVAGPYAGSTVAADAVVSYAAPLLTMALALAAFRWSRRDPRPLPGILGPWLPVYLLWLVVCTAFSRYPEQGWAVILRYALLLGFLTAIWNTWTRRSLGRAMLAMGFLLVPGALLALHQAASVGLASYFTSSALFPERVLGVFGNPNTLGLSLTQGAVVLIAWLLAPGRTRPTPFALRLVAIAVIGILTFGIVLSFSRASILYLVAATGILLLVRRWVRWVAVAGVGALLAFAIQGSLPLWLFFRLRLHTGTSSRSDLWDAAWRVMLDHPWTGVGPGDLTFEEVRGSFLDTSVIRQLSDTWAGGAHNVFFQNAAQLGIPGLCLVAVLFVAVLVRVPDALRRYARGDWLSGLAGAAFVGLLLHGMFEIGSTVGPGRLSTVIPFWTYALLLLTLDRPWPAESREAG